MAKHNFLLGKAERLSRDIEIKSLGGPKIAPYTFREARSRLLPMFQQVAENVAKLPLDACPDDLAVATITMNPEYIAKSYFPSDLLKAAGLEAIGSRSKNIKPEKKSRDREPEETFTTELFVRGKRRSFTQWVQALPFLLETDPGAKQLNSIEAVGFMQAQDKVKGVERKSKNIVYEVVLHIDEESAENKFLPYFKAYLNKRQLKTKFQKRFYSGGLCFLEMEGPADQADYIAEFSLVRVVREMPSLRLINPPIRTTGLDNSVKTSIHSIAPLDPNIKVAIFDGGIPEDHPITHWATPYDAPGVGAKVNSLLEHGVGVTSAFLFGHIDPDKPLPQPYANVDHYRVLDLMPGQNPYELYEILERISDIIKTKPYQFINLSIGPCLPVDDHEVHAWTAVLDNHLSDGLTLATIAVGNEGEGDPTIQANRVQVPADCVNALSIGACDLPDANWKRAIYSSVGPGRSPGVIKPDLVEFGGSVQRPFLVLDANDGTSIVPTAGTSYSSPATLRMGTGVRAHFGDNLSALAIRALLIHCVESTEHAKLEVGWGRLARQLEDIVISGDTAVRVVYQGKISASKFIRCPIPMPKGEIKGNVNIKATLCYATEVDPHHPDNYTKSGLEVRFRPHKDKKALDEEGRPVEHAKTKKFFAAQQASYQTEGELRRDAWKWENCAHAEVKMRGSSLSDPAFDIHFNAREEGHNNKRSQEINYVLVITLEALRMNDLYDQVVRRYTTVLEQLVPVIDIPLRLKP